MSGAAIPGWRYCAKPHATIPYLQNSVTFASPAAALLGRGREVRCTVCVVDSCLSPTLLERRRVMVLPDDPYALVEGFGHSPLNVRMEITKKLLGMGQEKTEPALIRGLSNPVWSVRQDCANALASLGSDHAIPHLILALRDPEPGVRYEAARALSVLDNDAGKDALRKLAREVQDKDFRHYLYDCIDGHVD